MDNLSPTSPTKMSIFEGASPKLVFILGLISGIAIVSLISWGLVLLSGQNSLFSFFGNGSGDKIAKPTAFTTCLDSGEFATKVQTDLQEGGSLGVGGTPSSFVNGVIVEGAVPYDNFKQVIEQSLKGEIPEGAAKVDISLKDNDYILGDSNAQVTVVEYSDLECPYCKRFHPTRQQIMAEFPGQVRWVFRHFPLNFHANAQKEAEAAECAGKLGGAEKYWQFVDKIFERTTSNGTGFALTDLPKLAEELGIK
ncbi:MAG: thioredoxin domain-containing protein [Patescibacteria group bacterium]